MRVRLAALFDSPVPPALRLGDGVGRVGRDRDEQVADARRRRFGRVKPNCRSAVAAGGQDAAGVGDVVSTSVCPVRWLTTVTRSVHDADRSRRAARVLVLPGDGDRAAGLRAGRADVEARRPGGRPRGPRSAGGGPGRCSSRRSPPGCRRRRPRTGRSTGPAAALAGTSPVPDDRVARAGGERGLHVDRLREHQDVGAGLEAPGRRTGRRGRSSRRRRRPVPKLPTVQPRSSPWLTATARLRHVEPVTCRSTLTLEGGLRRCCSARRRRGRWR